MKTDKKNLVAVLISATILGGCVSSYNRTLTPEELKAQEEQHLAERGEYYAPDILRLIKLSPNKLPLAFSDWIKQDSPEELQAKIIAVHQFVAEYDNPYEEQTYSLLFNLHSTKQDAIEDIALNERTAYLRSVSGKVYLTPQSIDLNRIDVLNGTGSESGVLLSKSRSPIAENGKPFLLCSVLDTVEKRYYEVTSHEALALSHTTIEPAKYVENYCMKPSKAAFHWSFRGKLLTEKRGG